MESATKTRIAITGIGTVVVFFLTLALSALTVSTAQATPQIAKGKPCGTCHAGSPPSKSNLKK